MEIIAIGRCLSIERKNERFLYRLHFKGFYSGKPVQVILLEGKKRTQELERNKDYIIHVKFRSHKTKELYGKILSVKEVDSIKCDFL